MNKRQAKKNFKKKYGCNPPKNLAERLSFAIRRVAEVANRFTTSFMAAREKAKEEQNDKN